MDLEQLMVETLSQNCRKLTESHVTSLVKTPPFLSILQEYQGELNDETVCKIVTDTALGLSVFAQNYKKVFRIARCIYKDVYQESPDCLYPEVHVLSEYEDQTYLLEVLNPLSNHSKRILLSHIGFLDAAQNSGKIKDIQTAYLVFEQVFFTMIWRKYRTSKHEDQRNQYYAFRNIADEFCSIVFEDKTIWRERLAAKIEK